MAEEVKGTVNVGVPAQVHADLAALSERRRWKIRDVVGGVLEWWLRQPATVQRAILGDVDEGMEDAYSIALTKLAENLRSGASQIRVAASTPPGMGKRKEK